MILESLVTTADRQGRVNLAPMGPIVPEDYQTLTMHQLWFQLRPYSSSQTFKNLVSTRTATIHVTDNVDLFARAVTGGLEDRQYVESIVDCLEQTFYVLQDCHRWFAVDVEFAADLGADLKTAAAAVGHRDAVRPGFICRVRDSGTVRPFFGFNRAKHAVVEAAILASRIEILPIQQIRAELTLLAPLVEKTGGKIETDAFERIKRMVETVNEDRSSHHSIAST